MNIAFHVPRAAYLDERASGGDPVMVRVLVDGLRARGHRVEVVSRLDARDVGRGRIPARRLLVEALGVRSRMRALGPDAWLVYGPSVTYPDFFGWWLRPGRYVLYAAHRGKEQRLPRRLRGVFAFAHRRSLARADEITVHRPSSPLLRERARDPGANVHVLPPAPRAWDVVPSRQEARERLGLPARAPVVLCLARFPKHSKYGKTEMAITLLGMVSRLDERVLLLLVGDNGPGLGRVEDEIARLDLGARVRLLLPDERGRLFGSVSNENVPWFYAAADVYAYPHALDTPWLSLFEAPACGRPVVTMRTGSAALAIRHGETGLLARDENEFGSFLAALLDDPARCEAMGRAASAHFAANLSLDRHLDRLEALLLGP